MNIPPLALLTLCSAVAGGLAYNLPLMNFTVPLWFIALDIILAALFLLPAVVSFVRNHTTVNPQKPGAASTLVTDGVYQFSRNPMYVGMLLLLIALVLWLGAVSATVAVVIFFLLIDLFQIELEEKYLRRNFGTAFDHYAKHTPRWLIFIKKD